MADETKRDPLPADVDPLDYFKVGVVRPSPADPRDHKPPPALREPVPLPGEFQLPPTEPRNQIDRGSCGAFGVVRQVEWEFAKRGVSFDGSEEYQYAITRQLMNELCQDSGSDPRSALRAAAEFGALSEAQCPYKSRDLCWQPDQTFTAAARQNTAGLLLEYVRADGDDASIKRLLYGTNGADGHKVACCVLVYENFQPDAAGVIPTPRGRVLGGHWMTFEGWSDARAAWWVQNQWSGQWGMNGGCWIPYQVAALPDDRGGVWRGDLWALRATALPIPPTPPEPPAPSGCLDRVSAYIQEKWLKYGKSRVQARTLIKEMQRELPSLLEEVS
jgi:C1A family cysteine protease